MRPQDTLKTWTLALALAWGGLCACPNVAMAIPTGGVQAQLATESFEELRAQWDLAFAQRRKLDATLRDLETTYLKLTERIAVLKAKGAGGSRPELERLLRQAKALASDLQAQQSRVQAVDLKLQGLGKVLVQELDAERLRLERNLVLARDPGTRASIVMELNAISGQRASYVRHAQPREPLAVGAILHDAQALEDPNDMLAMADELQDAEAQVQQKLARIESGLKELRDRQRLLRRAARFSREENFFEEGDRARVYATRRVQNSTEESTPAAAPTRPDAAPQRPEVGEAPKNTGDGAPAYAPQADPNDGVRGDVESGGNLSAGAPSAAPLTDAPSQAPVAPEQPSSPAAAPDPFAPSGPVIVLDEQPTRTSPPPPQSA